MLAAVVAARMAQGQILLAQLAKAVALVVQAATERREPLTQVAVVVAVKTTQGQAALAVPA
jgi:hypothetical protein